MGLVDLSPRALGHAHALPVLGAAHPDTRRLAVLGVHERHVGHVHRALPFDHADLRIRARGVRTLMALDHVHAFDVDTVLARLDPDDLAGPALVLAGDDDHVVVGLQLHAHACFLRGVRASWTGRWRRLARTQVRRSASGTSRAEDAARRRSAVVARTSWLAGGSTTAPPARARRSS